MTPASPATLREWFEAALEQPAADRTRWLTAHCADALLRARLATLLAAHADTEGPLDAPVARVIEDFSEPPVLAESLLGSRIGDFRLQRLLGQGGMATVFLAAREGSDFSQKVAVKLLRRGLYSDVEQRLFRRERQALASLSHPSIARLIDGGVTDAGIPYLVMEYIDGKPVTTHAVEQQLDLRARLRVFVAICRAVEAAHRGLIVHRDIKPSNILVDSEGAVKLLDFGIAKLLDEDGDTLTRTSLVPLTPGYAAPEQFAGGPITTATDVYALGVLLHELLLGERPQDDTLRRPSARAAELVTDLWQLPTSRQALRAALKGDLDNVLLKALAVEPLRRYASAGAFADDIERHLLAQPVSAHPPSRWYRTRKFAQRHRGGVLVTAALLLGVLASLSLALWQARVARAQAQRAENVRDFLLNVFEAAKDQLPRDARPTPDVLARAAAKRVDADTSLDPPTRAEFLATLGAISYTGSDYAQAQTYADRALALLDAIGDTDTRKHLGVEIARANAIYSLGKIADADKLLAARIATIRAVADRTAVEGISAYAATRLANGAIDEALLLAREASGMADRVHGANSTDALIAGLLPGDVLSSAGRHKEAVIALEAAFARWDATTAAPNRDYVTSLQNLGSSLYFMGDYDACERRLREALQLAMRIFEAPHEHIADVLQSLGALESTRGHSDAAEPLLQQAETMYVTLFGPDHPQVAGARAALGTLALDRARYEEAARIFTSVTDLCTRAKLDGDPLCPRSWQNLSFAYQRLGRLDDAEAANLRSVEMRRALYGERHPQYANALSGRASILLLRGDAAAALAIYDQALGIVRDAGLGDNYDAAIMLFSRGKSLYALQRDAEALAVFGESEKIMQRIAPGDTQRRLVLLAARANAEARLQRVDAARLTAREALGLESHKAALNPGQWERLQALAR